MDWISTSAWRPASLTGLISSAVEKVRDIESSIDAAMGGDEKSAETTKPSVSRKNSDHDGDAAPSVRSATASGRKPADSEPAQARDGTRGWGASNDNVLDYYSEAAEPAHVSPAVPASKSVSASPPATAVQGHQSGDRKHVPSATGDDFFGQFGQSVNSAPSPAPVARMPSWMSPQAPAFVPAASPAAAAAAADSAPAPAASHKKASPSPSPTHSARSRQASPATDTAADEAVASRRAHYSETSLHQVAATAASFAASVTTNTLHGRSRDSIAADMEAGAGDVTSEVRPLDSLDTPAALRHSHPPVPLASPDSLQAAPTVDTEPVQPVLSDGDAVAEASPVMSAATLAELQTARESAQQAASALQAAQAESANLRLQLNNVTATLSSREAQLESMSAATARLMDEMNALRAAKDAADGKAAAAERELAEERKANAAKAGKRDKAATEIAKLQVWFMFHSML